MLKGLILKDLYSVKFQIAVSILLFLIPNIELIAMAVTDLEGNGETGREWFITACYVFVSFISIVISSSFFVNTVSEDVSCGWYKMARTMPITVRMISGGKILSSSVIIAILMLLSLSVNLFGISMGAGNAEILIAAPFCSALLQLTALSPVFPFALRFGAGKATPFYLCFLAVLAAALDGLSAVCLKCDTGELLRVIFYGGIPAAAAISVFLSVKFSKKILVD